MANIMKKLNSLINPSDDEYDDEYYEDEYEDEDAEEESKESPSIFRKNPKLVSIQKPQLQVVVYRPISFKEDTAPIAKALMANNAVVVNLEKTEKLESRRILDFLSGVAFAQNGKLSTIATATYMITPHNVELSGEELFDEFENSGVYF